MLLDYDAYKRLKATTKGYDALVRYYLFDGTEEDGYDYKVLESGKRNSNTTCFASLNKDRTNEQYMCYIVPEKLLEKVEENILWLKLSQKYQTFPKEASIERLLEERKFVIDLTKYTQNELYLYLSTVRALAEEALMVRVALFLILQYNVDYFTAVYIAWQAHVNNSNHFYIPHTFKDYPTPDDITKININTAHIYGLLRAVVSFHIKIQDLTHFTGFTCNKTVALYSKKYEDNKTFTLEEVCTKEYKQVLKAIITEIHQEAEAYT